MTKQRKIIHIDMDCFYAAIEMRDNPELKKHPIAVGGAADKRGVLCTCNYQAREYGIHSAMPTATALRLCPSLKLLPVDMAKYKHESQRIQQIFCQYTDKIEPLSLDEAYLDVSDCKQYQGSATFIAQAIRHEIFNTTQLTASAGIAPNKCLAKIASDWNKPNGQFVITPQDIDEFVEDLPVRKIPGVGKVTEQKLLSLGYATCGDLQKLSLKDMLTKFSSFGDRLYHLCRGIDDREVITERKRKSLSVEETFEHDLIDLSEILNELEGLQTQLKTRLMRLNEERTIHKQFVKMKFSDFTQTTVECLSDSTHSEIYHDLMTEAYSRKNRPVRLCGIGVRFIEEQEHQQLNLFSD